MLNVDQFRIVFPRMKTRATSKSQEAAQKDGAAEAEKAETSSSEEEEEFDEEDQEEEETGAVEVEERTNDQRELISQLQEELEIQKQLAKSLEKRLLALERKEEGDATTAGEVAGSGALQRNIRRLLTRVEKLEQKKSPSAKKARVELPRGRWVWKEFTTQGRMFYSMLREPWTNTRFLDFLKDPKAHLEGQPCLRVRE